MLHLLQCSTETDLKAGHAPPKQQIFALWGISDSAVDYPLITRVFQQDSEPQIVSDVRPAPCMAPMVVPSYH